MRKIVMFNLVSADGFFAGPDGNIDWHVVDDEFDAAAVEMVRPFDTILFGRITYQLFEGYWPKAATNPATSPNDRIIANKFNEMTKIVFSRTLPRVDWKNTSLRKAIVREEIEALKSGAGKDMVIYGSGTIVQQMTDLGLIDEYRLLFNPVVLGRGKTLFHNVHQVRLRLLGTRVFSSGSVLLNYRPG